MLSILTKKSFFTNAGLSLIAMIVMTKLKSFSIADSIICFVVVMLLLTSLDIANNWFMYKLFKKKDEKINPSKK